MINHRALPSVLTAQLVCGRTTPKRPVRDDPTMLGYGIDIMEDALDASALRQAADAIAGQAEILASEMESGAIADCGGPDALRLLAAVVRLHSRYMPPISGHA